MRPPVAASKSSTLPGISMGASGGELGTSGGGAAGGCGLA
jgi:hypothetical protein